MPDESDSPSDIEVIKQRKKEGIVIPLTRNVQAKESSTYLEYVKLIHNALPEIDFDAVETSQRFLGHNFKAPIIIDSMTGGTPEATKINSRLSLAAEKFGLGMGLGSQRAGLLSSELAETYSIARSNAPNAFLVANIGGAQLSKGLKIKEIKNMIQMIEADALVVHLNPLQELIQPEGEPKYKGVLSKIKEICSNFDIPIIVKEVGAGISMDVAKRLQTAGVSAINVAGSGGTSWAGVEKLRAETAHDSNKINLGELFWDWGIPTAVSLMEVRKSVKIPVIASGGIRNGLEIAKCIALGADMCGMAFPFLRHASKSLESLYEFTNRTLTELRSAMFLVGSKKINQLGKTRFIVTGELARVK
ncbi:MAG TPA: type 2 isopentenyl-diphosphate Delta-isomerase [Nitrososphaeraceae archaeon]|jgi:isopentenyl-diphosphate delta-isomerase|nr:type 2 isopentenyl-diphosphate Delta-isomerase [Nitrososphaeraceae archaeon]